MILKHLKIRVKLTGAFLLTVILTGCLAVYSVYSTNIISKNLSTAIDSTRTSIEHTKNLQLLLKDLFLAINDVQSDYIDNKLDFGGGVTIVEWAEFIEELMPENTIHIRIEKDLSKGPDMRRISFE